MPVCSTERMAHPHMIGEISLALRMIHDDDNDVFNDDCDDVDDDHPR